VIAKGDLTMAIFEDMFEGGAGIAVALGALVIAPLARPLIRPVAKQVIKTGLVLYDKASVAMAELSEGVEDLVAEVRAEMAPGTVTEPARKPGVRHPST
jgi:hypothetical protein